MAKKKLKMGFLEDSLGYQLRRAQLSVFQDFANNCQEMGISAGLFSIVTVVYNNPGLTQTAVANALGIDRSAMVAALDKLEVKGWLERRKTESDRRSYALFVTSEGQAKYLNSLASVMQHEQNFIGKLNGDEAAQLRSLLTKLAN